MQVTSESILQVSHNSVESGGVSKAPNARHFLKSNCLAMLQRGTLLGLKKLSKQLKSGLVSGREKKDIKGKNF